MVAAACSESFVPVANAELYCRQTGAGRPVVVVHGGPDFDHRYLLPDLDRLSDGYRLIYYDQRGRGRSRGDVELETLGIERYVDDLDRVRASLQLDAVAVLGHSWGGHVALHYALRHPDRVSHLVLMNTAPACHGDYVLTRQERLRRRAGHAGALDALAARYRDGDPQAAAEFYRIDFAAAFARPDRVDRLRLSFTSRDDVLGGLAIEERLMQGLYWSQGFTLIPELRRLRVPALVIHGDRDFVPIEAAAHIVDAIPGARLVVIEECGHFAYIEAPERVREAMDAFFAGA
jgi:proline iminopeptidase